MDFIVDIVRVEDPDSPKELSLLDLTTSKPLEQSLYAFGKDLQAWINAHATGYDPSKHVLQRIKKLDEFITKAMATKLGVSLPIVDYGPLDTSGFREVKPGPDEPSIYVPELDTWSIHKEGKAYVLQIESDAPGDNVLLEDYRYDVQIRPSKELEVDTTKTCTYEVPAEALSLVSGADLLTITGAGGPRMVVYFTHTRSEIDFVKSTAPGASATTRDDVNDFNATQNAWTVNGPLTYNSTSGTVTIAIRFRGDPVHVRAVSYIKAQADGPEDACFHHCTCWCGPCSPLPAPPAVVTAASAEHLLTSGVTWKQEMAHRRCLIREKYDDDPFRLYYYDLDRLSSPNSGSLEFSSIGALCALYYLRRAADVHHGKSGKLRYTDEELEWYRGSIVSARKLLERIFSDHFPERGRFAGSTAYDLIEHFAMGRLGVFATHGAPNGVNFFCFAEIALLIVRLAELDVRRGEKKKAKIADRWNELFLVFARSSELFVRAYHRRGGQRHTCDYRVEFNRLGRRGPTVEEYEELVARWDTDAVEATYARLVYQALISDFDPALESPPDPPDFEPPYPS